MAQLLETKQPVLSTVLPVFIPGKYKPCSIKLDLSSPSSPPNPLLIFTPSEQGTYPVILFFHGFCLCNYFYSDLLQHISSHGFIIVAPQLWNIIPPCGTEEVESAAKVADWLPSGLPSVLPGNIEANLVKLALVGHSRGGKTAFALALGYTKTTQNFSALIGIDPVAGTTCGQTKPKILTYVTGSFNLSIPVTVIGTGLGPESKGCLPCPCAPNGLNHEEFFNECKPPRAHFVAKNYGHMDVLDDNPSGLVGKLSDYTCVSGKGPGDLMRRCVGGIVVAFLNYFFQGEKGDFMTIVNEPYVAPVKLDQVEFNI
ncbi:LOW QUALITY PROTEIN: chlorophyllase-1, chloroplastic-like [Durio zibethinus]|uniref:LOW QUALITY PROTEIN: chlorophyllase-1, chloroplastic-like n=1 Tax=Durio zibethinus TaxID=66656 RepID=A0A6P6AYJ8_DURZI|nr:LOW QUALITY PROTEIN: chlorophyllase-1, chloroplastic-like [Durio zibethinus]